MKKIIKKLLWKLCGMQKIQDQLDTQYYFLNAHINPASLPKAQGDLGLLQIADMWLLKIFDFSCKELNLTYWLDYGSLLGAVRHGGPIPWDDDQDLSMPRDDYEKAKTILPDFLSKYGIDVYWDDSTMDRICVSYKHKMTGTWIDLFPADYISPEKCSVQSDKDEDIISGLRSTVFQIQDIHKEYYTKHKHSIIDEKLNSVKNDLKKNDYLFSYPNVRYFWVAKKSNIFPLEYIEFTDVGGCSLYRIIM